MSRFSELQAKLVRDALTAGEREELESLAARARFSMEDDPHAGEERRGSKPSSSERLYELGVASAPRKRRRRPTLM